MPLPSTTISGFPELFLGKKGGYGVSLGDKKGALGLRFYEGTKERAEIGEAGDGSGAISLYNTSGIATTRLGSDTGRGYMEIDGSSGNPAVQLKQVANANGYFVVANRSGEARAEAGTLPGDRGIVRAWGPEGGANYIEGPK